MKQQIKCPHCNKEFSIEQVYKHENEEFRKKLEKQEQQKAKEKQKELVNEFCRQLIKIKTDILEITT